MKQINGIDWRHLIMMAPHGCAKDRASVAHRRMAKYIRYFLQAEKKLKKQDGKSLESLYFEKMQQVADVFVGERYYHEIYFLLNEYETTTIELGYFEFDEHYSLQQMQNMMV